MKLHIPVLSNRLANAHTIGVPKIKLTNLKKTKMKKSSLLSPKPKMAVE